MILDYNTAKSTFILRVKRGEHDIQTLIKDHGLDFSLPASNAQEAVLFTPEPYAAAPFVAYATPDAKRVLQPIIGEIEASWATDSNIRIACPPDRELWGFQKADIAYALRRKNTLIGDQPGLGKTPIAICFANEIKAKRVLVICPASIRLQWAKRIREWTMMSYPCKIHTIINGKHGVHPNAHYTIVSYELAGSEAIGRALARQQYDLLILDEAHYLKTSNSRRTQAVFGGGRNPPFEYLASRSERVLALTGTLLVNRPREAFTLAKGLCHDAIDWMDEEAFQDRFNPSETRQVQGPDGKTRIYVDERSGRHAELQARLRANFMTRHLKRDVMNQLQMPVYDIVQCNETAAVKQALQAESMLDIDPENLSGADAATLGHVAVVRRMMGIALAPQVAEYVDMLIDGGEEKIVLFAWHIEVLNILQEKLAKHNIVRVSSVGDKERKTQQFIDDPSIRVIMGNIQTLGLGTDGLQHVCNHALLAEPSWTPGDNQQAFDRLDRGGQKRTVQCDIFVAPGSFSEKVLASSLRKLSVIHKSLDRVL